MKELKFNGMTDAMEKLNMTKGDMKLLADHLEEYVNAYEDMFIVPGKYVKSMKKREENIKLARECIKNLRNNKNVFKDIDD